MDTIKTATVVALLLAVLYGVYTVLNKESVPPPAEVAALTEEEEMLMPPDIDLGLEGAGADATMGLDATEPPAAEVAANPSRTGNIYVQVEPRQDSATPGSAATRLPPADGGSTSADGKIYVNVEPHPERTAQAGSDGTSDAQPAATDEDSADTTTDAVDSAADFPTNPYASQAPNSAADAASRYMSPSPAVASPDVAETAAADSDTYSPDSAAPPAQAANDTAVASAIEGSATTEGSAAAAPDAGNTAASGAKLAPTRWSDVKRQAVAHIEAGRLREALATLSTIYGEPTLTPAENEELLGMLDPLAGRVIYSKEHLLEPSYQVRGGETLQQIAARYNVPWQLLQNINGIQKPEVLLPGTILKVVKGPFRAEVDLDRTEMTLFLDQLYAGRFPITVGNQPSPPPGDYAVQDKQAGRTYFATDGRTLPADHPDNPYGSVWLDLGVNNVCIHGSPSRDGAVPGGGCIGLSPIDARDVFGILSQGSRVTVYR